MWSNNLCTERKLVFVLYYLQAQLIGSHWAPGSSINVALTFFEIGATRYTHTLLDKIISMWHQKARFVFFLEEILIGCLWTLWFHSTRFSDQRCFSKNSVSCWQVQACTEVASWLNCYYQTRWWKHYSSLLFVRCMFRTARIWRL